MDELEALDHLDSLINYEVVPRAGAIEGLSLEPMLAFMGAIGDPQDAYPVIHLTGTNGKGSTSRMLERIFTVMGLRVGLYTSPHLHDVTERIRVGGESIGSEEFAQAIADVVRVEEVQGLGLGRGSTPSPRPPCCTSPMRPSMSRSSRSGCWAGSTRPTSSTPTSP